MLFVVRPCALHTSKPVFLMFNSISCLLIDRLDYWKNRLDSIDSIDSVDQLRGLISIDSAHTI